MEENIFNKSILSIQKTDFLKYLTLYENDPYTYNKLLLLHMAAISYYSTGIRSASFSLTITTDGEPNFSYQIETTSNTNITHKIFRASNHSIKNKDHSFYNAYSFQKYLGSIIKLKQNLVNESNFDNFENNSIYFLRSKHPLNYEDNLKSFFKNEYFKSFSLYYLIDSNTRNVTSNKKNLNKNKI